MLRKVLGCALLAAALGTSTAYAAGSGAGNGGSGGTGIVDWVTDFHTVGTNHGGLGMCEYASPGHFEAGVNATTFDSLTPSTARNLSVSCQFDGTSVGTLSASATNDSVAATTADTGPQRPVRICLSASITWANGDSWSASRCVYYGDVAVYCCQQYDVTVGPDSGTTRLLGSAEDAIYVCANSGDGCTDGLTETADRAANQVASGWTPGVVIRNGAGSG